jgi:hypothetical protein
MSWLFSQALVAAYSQGHCSDGEQFAPSSENHTPQAYLSSDRMTAFSTRSLSGMTFGLLTENLGGELLTWFLAVSPVRTCQLQVKVQGLKERDRVFGKKCGESLARLCRDTFSWRTAQLSLFGGWVEFSETWPEWGMMQDGECWAQSIPAHLTGEKEYGSWLTFPTPTKMDATLSTKGKAGAYNKHSVQLSHLATSGALTTENHWETQNKLRSMGLLSKAEAKHMEKQEDHLQLSGGKLNPNWVEWLMNWPIQWTDCKPLAMDKFQSWLQQHGGF